MTTFDDGTPEIVPPDDTRKFLNDAIEMGWRHHLAAWVAQHGLPQKDLVDEKKDSYRAGCMFALELVRQAGARQAMKQAEQVGGASGGESAEGG